MYWTIGYRDSLMGIRSADALGLFTVDHTLGCRLQLKSIWKTKKATEILQKTLDNSYIPK